MPYSSATWLADEAPLRAAYCAAKHNYGIHKTPIHLGYTFGVCRRYDYLPGGRNEGPQPGVTPADIESFWRITVDTSRCEIRAERIEQARYDRGSPIPDRVPECFIRPALLTAGSEVYFYPSFIAGFNAFVGPLLLERFYWWSNPYPPFQLTVHPSGENLGWEGTLCICEATWPTSFFDESSLCRLADLLHAVTTSPRTIPEPDWETGPTPPYVIVENDDGPMMPGAPVDRMDESAAVLLFTGLNSAERSGPTPVIGDSTGAYGAIAEALGGSVEHVAPRDVEPPFGPEEVADTASARASALDPTASARLRAHAVRSTRRRDPARRARRRSPEREGRTPLIWRLLCALGRGLIGLLARRSRRPPAAPDQVEDADAAHLGLAPRDSRVVVVADDSFVGGLWCSSWDGSAEALDRGHILFAPGFATCLISRRCPNLWLNCVRFDPMHRVVIYSGPRANGLSLRMVGRFDTDASFAAALRTLPFYGAQSAGARPPVGLSAQYHPHTPSIEYCPGGIPLVASRYDFLVGLCHVDYRFELELSCADWVSALSSHSRVRKHLNAAAGFPADSEEAAVPAPAFVVCRRCVPYALLGALLDYDVVQALMRWLQSALVFGHRRHSWELQRTAVELTRSRSLAALRVGVDALTTHQPVHFPGHPLRSAYEMQGIARRLLSVPDFGRLCLASPPDVDPAEFGVVGMSSAYHCAIQALAQPDRPRSVPQPSAAPPPPPAPLLLLAPPLPAPQPPRDPADPFPGGLVDGASWSVPVPPARVRKRGARGRRGGGGAAASSAAPAAASASVASAPTAAQPAAQAAPPHQPQPPLPAAAAAAAALQPPPPSAAAAAAAAPAAVSQPPPAPAFAAVVAGPAAPAGLALAAAAASQSSQPQLAPPGPLPHIPPTPPRNHQPVLGPPQQHIPPPPQQPQGRPPGQAAVRPPNSGAARRHRPPRNQRLAGIQSSRPP